jgi:hypothetical protein
MTHAMLKGDDVSLFFSGQIFPNLNSSIGLAARSVNKKSMLAQSNLATL